MFLNDIKLVVIFLLCFDNVILEPNAIQPPIVRVTNKGEISNSKYDVKIRKYTKVSYRPIVRMVTSEISTTSSTTKPDVETNNIIDVPTVDTFEENLLNGDIEHDVSKEQCAFTFTMPNPLPTSQQVCVKDIRSMTSQKSDENKEEKDALLSLRDELSEWQRSLEDLRSDIEEQLAIPGLESIQNNVRLLQKESRNMNFRISQLYMQLLHEIIRKRDDTIDFTAIENSVLNLTVKYYELKEKHEELAIDHNQLKRKSEVQQGKIQNLQNKMDEVVKKVDKLMINQEILMQARGKSGPSPIVTSPSPRAPTSFRDCNELQLHGQTTSGQYSLSLPNMSKKIKVWCDFDQDPGGWTVIQRRSDRKVNFYRNMASYQRGFGLLSGDFWLGLENMHQLTNQHGITYKLHIDMEDWNKRKTFVEYEYFKVGSQDDGYRLKIAHYSGNAGDSLTWHNNMKFTAKNVDNDLYFQNCANFQKGGWWYNSCAHSNLNGIYHAGGHYSSTYQEGIYWKDWRGASYSLKRVEMKIRPID